MYILIHRQILVIYNTMNWVMGLFWGGVLLLIEAYVKIILETPGHSWYSALDIIV